VADERVRLEIAFRSGQTLTIVVPVSAADALDAALAKGDPESLSFEAEDGRYTVVVKMVAFVKRHARESRVGFGAG
jgi:hypothetical protein